MFEKVDPKMSQGCYSNISSLMVFTIYVYKGRSFLYMTIIRLCIDLRSFRSHLIQWMKCPRYKLYWICILRIIWNIDLKKTNLLKTQRKNIKCNWKVIDMITAAFQKLLLQLQLTWKIDQYKLHSMTLGKYNHYLIQCITITPGLGV